MIDSSSPGECSARLTAHSNLCGAGSTFQEAEEERYKLDFSEACI
jgi:hypothetical protein